MLQITSDPNQSTLPELLGPTAPVSETPFVISSIFICSSNTNIMATSATPRAGGVHGDFPINGHDEKKPDGLELRTRYVWPMVQGISPQNLALYCKDL